MDELMKIINKKFLKDHELLYLEDLELLYLEDHELVKSCEYVRPHNAHYKEYLVIINNNGHDEKYTVCCKFI